MFETIRTYVRVRHRLLTHGGNLKVNSGRERHIMFQRAALAYQTHASMSANHELHHLNIAIIYYFDV